MKLQAEEKEKQIPYLFSFYNIKAFYPTEETPQDTFLSGIHNALVGALNDRINYHLPRYLLIVLDSELVEAADGYDYGAVEVFTEWIEWLLVNINESIEFRKQDLLRKRPGAIASTSEPWFIWVTMLKRPNSTTKKEVFALTRKFNTTLEQVIANDKCSHILKVHVEGSEANFEEDGTLTATGQVQFWCAIDEEMADFDYGKTELEPVKIIKTIKNNIDNQKNFKQNPFKWDKYRRY